MNKTMWILAGWVVSMVLPVWGQTSEPASKWADRAPEGTLVTDEGWFAPVTPRLTPPELPENVTRAYVIPFKTDVSEVAYKILKYKAQICRQEKAQLVVLDITSPGGRLDMCNKIISLLTHELKDITTIAYVDEHAYSAAAMIALACTDIVMKPGSKIGAASPVTGTGQAIPDADRAKYESAMRAEARQTAEDRGHSAILCEAMITRGIEVWLIRDRATGQLKLVDADNWIGKTIGAPPAKDIPAAPADATWEYVRRIDKDDSPAALTTAEAKRIGLADAVCDTLDDAILRYGFEGKPIVLVDRPLDQVALFLTSPAIAAVLVMGIMIGAYQEFRTPGLGIFGAIAVLCLTLLIGSRMMVGLANVAEVCVVGLGILLLIAEIFVIPGFGVAGVSGLVLIFAGLVAMWVPNGIGEFPLPQIDGDGTMLLDGVGIILGGFCAGVIASLLMMKFFPETKLARRSNLVLDPQSMADADSVALAEQSAMRQVSAGDVGIALTPLHPVGQARFDGHVIDVITEGEMIATRTPVRVLHREGNHIVVTADTDS
jgi:membrane-bound serine protease (ClpP class)